MPQIAVIRAIPASPHKHRWCGLERWKVDPKNRPQQEMREKTTGGFEPVFDEAGKPVYAKHAIPWPADEVKVEVVENPASFDPDANGGRPLQISPATLAACKRDRRIAVQVLNDDGADPSEAIVDKAAIAKSDATIADLQRHVATLQEQVTQSAEAAAAKAMAEISKLREENAQLKSKIAELPRKK